MKEEERIKKLEEELAKAKGTSSNVDAGYRYELASIIPWGEKSEFLDECPDVTNKAMTLVREPKVNSDSGKMTVYFTIEGVEHANGDPMVFKCCSHKWGHVEDDELVIPETITASVVGGRLKK